MTELDMNDLPFVDGGSGRGGATRRLGGGENDLEDGAFTYGTRNIDRAGVLLHDSIGDREAQARTLAVALRGITLRCKERIVDAAEHGLGHADAVVLHAQVDGCAGVVRGDADARGLAALERVLGVQDEVDEDLLQLAAVARDLGQRSIEGGDNLDVRGSKLVFEQEGCVAHDGVEIDAAELARTHAREVEQAVDNLRGAEGLLRDLVEDGLQASVRGFICAQLFAELLAQHLGVAGDDGERRVDLVRNSSGKQTYGRELLGLRELRLHIDAVGDVVDDHDAADGLELTVEQ